MLLSPIRFLLRHLRFRTGQASRFASRLNRVSRYGWDLVLWTHLLGRTRDPIPVDFPPQLLADKRVGWQPPVLHVSGPPRDIQHWDTGFAAVNAALLLNLQMPDVLSRVRYAHPAPAFQGIYLWDSAFIAPIWKHWDRAVADDVLTAVVELADEGRLQHVVADFVQSKYTQPPLLAWSLMICFGDGSSESVERLRRLYPTLKNYHFWLRENRRHDSGLFYWEHPYESGIDNSPRFASRDESRFADTRQIGSPDFSTYMVLQAESLRDIANLLGKASDAGKFQQFAAELRSRTNELLWDPRSEFYFDRQFESQEFVACRTIAGLLPLWAGIPSQSQAKALLAHIVDRDQFSTLVPLPTVARDEATFAKDMWCGPVWINTATAVILGLERYEFWEAAADFSYRLCDGVYRTFDNCRRIFEFYDPDRFGIEELSRKQGNRWKKWTLGSKPVTEFVGWSGLVNWLVIEHLVGFNVNVDGFRLRPLLPRQSIGQAFCLRLPQYELSITAERTTGDEIVVNVRSAVGLKRFSSKLGETIEFALDHDGPTDIAAKEHRCCSAAAVQFTEESENHANL